VSHPDPEEEQPIAWKAIRADTKVFSSDDEEIGPVHEVLGSEAEDIFHGIVVRSAHASHEVMIPASHIPRITNQRIESDMSVSEVRSLPPYRAEDTFHLGLTGLLRKHLGWVKEERDPPK